MLAKEALRLQFLTRKLSQENKEKKTRKKSVSNVFTPDADIKV